VENVSEVVCSLNFNYNLGKVRSFKSAHVSFLSEELFLDVETGEEFHDPHR